jgi:N-acetylgalactosamine 4-sulfate 6-O-sulfotransferase
MYFCRVCSALSNSLHDLTLHTHTPGFQKKPETKQYQYNPKGFHLAVLQSIEEMNRCFEEHPARVCAWEQRRYHPVTQIQLGMYSEFVETWLRYFPKEQLKVVRMEDLTQEPRAFFDTVTDFVGLSRLTDVMLFGPDGKQVKKSNSGRKRNDMLPETRALLDVFYAPYAAKLAEMFENPLLDYTKLQKKAMA